MPHLHCAKTKQGLSKYKASIVKNQKYHSSMNIISRLSAKANRSNQFHNPPKKKHIKATESINKHLPIKVRLNTE